LLTVLNLTKLVIRAPTEEVQPKHKRYIPIVPIEPAGGSWVIWKKLDVKIDWARLAMNRFPEGN
jgi:hypothetical protein